MIDILRGSETGKIVRFNHHRLPVFGAGAERAKTVWRSLIRQMVATGLLRLDIAGYGGLATTETGRALLRGEGAFHYREDTAAARPAAAAATPREKPGAQHGTEPSEPPPLDDEQAALLAALKALRLQLAKEREVPAFVVFHDRCPDRHGPAPPAHGGGVRRGQRRRRSQAGAVRCALPRGHRGGDVGQGLSGGFISFASDSYLFPQAPDA